MFSYCEDKFLLDEIGGIWLEKRKFGEEGRGGFFYIFEGFWEEELDLFCIVKKGRIRIYF